MEIHREHSWLSPEATVARNGLMSYLLCAAAESDEPEMEIIARDTGFSLADVRDHYEMLAEYEFVLLEDGRVRATDTARLLLAVLLDRADLLDGVPVTCTSSATPA